MTFHDLINRGEYVYRPYLWEALAQRGEEVVFRGDPLKTPELSLVEKIKIVCFYIFERIKLLFADYKIPLLLKIHSLEKAYQVYLFECEKKERIHNLERKIKENQQIQPLLIDKGAILHALLQNCSEEERASNQKALEDLEIELAAKGWNGKTIFDAYAEKRELLELIDQAKTTKAKEELDLLLRDAVKPLSPLQRMEQDLEERVSKDFKEVWHLLFEKYQGSCTNYSLDEGGRFFLTLSEEHYLWVPSSDEEGKKHPLGGICMALAKDVEGKIEQNGLHFDEGFKAYLKSDVPGLPFSYPIEIDADIVRLTYDGQTGLFQFAAGKILRIFGMTYKLAKDRAKTKEYLTINWSQNSIPIKSEEQARQFIREQRERDLREIADTEGV